MIHPAAQTKDHSSQEASQKLFFFSMGPNKAQKRKRKHNGPSNWSHSPRDQLTLQIRSSRSRFASSLYWPDKIIFYYFFTQNKKKQKKYKSELCMQQGTLDLTLAVRLDQWGDVFWTVGILGSSNGGGRRVAFVGVSKRGVKIIVFLSFMLMANNSNFLLQLYSLLSRWWW